MIDNIIVVVTKRQKGRNKQFDNPEYVLIKSYHLHLKHYLVIYFDFVIMNELVV
jgi:hypothetical protein